jgi:hypothetical protein
MNTVFWPKISLKPLSSFRGPSIPSENGYHLYFRALAQSCHSWSPGPLIEFVSSIKIPKKNCVSCRCGRSQACGDVHGDGRVRQAGSPRKPEPPRIGTVSSYLNRKSPGSREGGTLWPSKPSGSLSREAWLFFHGQILTSLFRPLLYHRSIQSANLSSPPHPPHKVATNTS